MASVDFEGVTKVYPNGTVGVDELELHVDDGEFVVLVGPSGCGKSTALRMVAGLEDVSHGVVRIGGKPVNDMAPRDRDIAMVFQSYALYPHLTVRDNIGFALRMRRMSKNDIDARVSEAAHILGLTELLDRKPAQLSGGQRQRVAMGRAIVREPAVFLMDEPLSNLDAKLRVQMRAEIARLQARLGVTTLYVTHDQVEAMTLGDRVAVLRAGVLQQVDTPQALYDKPRNLFVAAFIGSPSMNLFEAAVDGDNIVVGDQRLPRPRTFGAARPAGPIAVGIRPEDLAEIDDGADPSSPGISVVVELVEALGSELLVHFRLPGVRDVSRDVVVDEEEAESGVIAPQGAPGTARLGPHTPVTAGDTIRLRVDVQRLHFFDLTTSEALP